MIQGGSHERITVYSAIYKKAPVPICRRNPDPFCGGFCQFVYTETDRDGDGWIGGAHSWLGRGGFLPDCYFRAGLHAGGRPFPMAVLSVWRVPFHREGAAQ